MGNTGDKEEQMGSGGKPGFTEKLTCTSNNGNTVSLSNEEYSVAISGPKEELEYFVPSQSYVVSVTSSAE
jgi:hypothetical protein